MAKIKSGFLILSLQIFIQITKIESIAEMGVVGAGVPAHNLHHNHYDSNHVLNLKPSLVPATTVDRVETFSNGCYKQIAREADVKDIRKFVQTEQLICPPGINPSSFTISNLHIMPPVQATHLMPNQTNGTLHYATPQSSPEFKAHNITHANRTDIAVIPDMHNSSLGGLPTVTSQQKIEPSEDHSPVWAEIPDAATSEVLIISRKIGYYDKEHKSNAANNLYSVNWQAIFLTMTIFACLM